MPIQQTPDINLPRESVKASKVQSRKQVKKARPISTAPVSSGLGTVYSGQPPVTDAEVSRFVQLLPNFRTWAKQNGEEAHPILSREGMPDFLYSPKAAAWVESQGFNAARFFCVMGKMAAALVIMEEGNDFKGTRPADMPEVSPTEIELAHKRMRDLVVAGGAPQPLN